jgi:hypothetical protein
MRLFDILYAIQDKDLHFERQPARDCRVKPAGRRGKAEAAEDLNRKARPWRQIQAVCRIFCA